MSNNEIDGFLLGGGGKSASFETIGDRIAGTILSAEVKEQTDIATGKVQTWDNGEVKKQLVVKLQTTLSDDEDDDGVRAIYVKGSKKAGSRSLHDAVAGAVRAAGAKSLEIGGTLTVVHDGTEPSSTRGFSDRKLYSATYAAPNKAAQAGDFLGTLGAAPAATQATPPAQAAPAAAAAAQNVMAGMSPDQLAEFQRWSAGQQAQQV